MYIIRIHVYMYMYMYMYCMYTTRLYGSDGEHLTGGELDEYVRQVVTTGPLQEAGPETVPPKDIMRYIIGEHMCMYNVHTVYM